MALPVVSTQLCVDNKIPPVWEIERRSRSTSESHWYAGDSEENYRLSGPHPVFGPQDIVYTFNSAGYRSPEFGVKAGFTIVSIGAEEVFGTGLPFGALFHNRLSGYIAEGAKTTVVNFNLGLDGVSNDYIVRMLPSATAALKPNLVLVVFPPMARREYIAASKHYLKFCPDRHVKSKDRIEAELAGQLEEISNPFTDLAAAWRSYRAVAAMLEKTPWLGVFSSASDYAALRRHLNPQLILGSVPLVDTARDNRSPGPASHQVLFEQFRSRVSFSRP